MLLLLVLSVARAESWLRHVEVVGDGQYMYESKPISPWHDLPFASGLEGGVSLLTFVCEIPLGTRAKMEIHKSVEYNKVVQDRNKDGSLRFYAYGDSIVNYGAIAQTWEDPDIPDPDTGLGGDNDPVDVLQLNAKPCHPGAVQRVRVLGALALVDHKETDWKLLVVDVDDADTAWRTLDDVPDDRIHQVREWFRLYKTAEGKPENEYAFEGRVVDAKHARSLFGWTDIRCRPCASRAEHTSTGADSSKAMGRAPSTKTPAGYATPCLCDSLAGPIGGPHDEQDPRPVTLTEKTKNEPRLQ